MAVTFSIADQDACDRVARMICLYHPELHEAGVTVGTIFAANEGGEPSIKMKGAAVKGTMQVVSLKDRVLKKVDAQMVLALECWDKMTEAERNALVDHELCHIQLKKWGRRMVLDANGEPTGEEVLWFDRDDLGRPKLALVNGDVEGGDGFAAVIARHGAAAGEYQNLTRVGLWARKALGDGIEEMGQDLIDEIKLHGQHEEAA